MPDEHELRVLVAGLLAPRLQPAPGLRRELPRGHAVVAPPVVRELEEVLAVLDVEVLLDVVDELRVAVDLPDPGDEVDVANHRRRRDAVDVVDVDRIVRELQVLEVSAERPERVEDGAPGDVPDVLPALAQDGPGDPGDADDDVGHEVPGRHDRLLSSKGGRQVTAGDSPTTARGLSTVLTAAAGGATFASSTGGKGAAHDRDGNTGGASRRHRGRRRAASADGGA